MARLRHVRRHRVGKGHHAVVLVLVLRLRFRAAIFRLRSCAEILRLRSCAAVLRLRSCAAVALACRLYAVLGTHPMCACPAQNTPGTAHPLTNVFAARHACHAMRCDAMRCDARFSVLYSSYT